MNLAEDERDTRGGRWLMMPVVVNVTGHEEIEASISVVVAKGCAV
jgi:hypothetical protein